MYSDIHQMRCTTAQLNCYAKFSAPALPPVLIRKAPSRLLSCACSCQRFPYPWPPQLFMFQTAVMPEHVIAGQCLKVVRMRLQRLRQTLQLGSPAVTATSWRCASLARLTGALCSRDGFPASRTLHNPP